MSADAVICFSTTLRTDAIHGALEHHIDFNISDAHDLTWLPSDATHIVDYRGRHFSETNPRGNWPIIATILMELHACLQIDQVWYGSDADENIEECTASDVLQLCQYYMIEGNRLSRIVVEDLS